MRIVIPYFSRWASAMSSTSLTFTKVCSVVYVVLDRAVSGNSIVNDTEGLHGRALFTDLVVDLARQFTTRYKVNRHLTGEATIFVGTCRSQTEALNVDDSLY
jgi:hypothetical protein